MPEDKKDKRVRVVVGEELARDITSMDGAMVLCRKGTIVTQELIERLSNWIVEEEPRLTAGEERPRRKAAPSRMRDEVLRRLEFEEIVSKKTRQSLENGAEGFFGGVTRDKQGGHMDLAELEDAIQELVQGTPDNPDVPIKLFELKKHSSYMYQHSIECGVIASYVATTLNYHPMEVNNFSMAMMLHDTGILEVPMEVLDRAGPLGDEEWTRIQGHTRRGFEVLKRVPGIDPLALIMAMGHHTYADGSGYPAEVDFNELPPLVHLSAVINHFEALTSARPYRPAFSLFDAVQIILSQRQKYHPAAIENFVRVIGIYPISTFVQLNTGEVGVVVRNNQDGLFLPEVKLVLDQSAKPYHKEIVVNLLEEQERLITGVRDSV
jgi:HD-GYP domain-containing protein (c-di-GMP phosphodiesterase class II)